ncbi:tyrosine-type recombinase/integrase [Cupriavidus taiwanensis]|uniref:tyrosine-type recombinase/integrase n=1 Tax=Cupriavidus taiwanensis TaxID=164546 RepID=UPI00253F7E3B|nr:tyrosine-type recombinase/integrase [Cupriavidus taiwanensis]MDK3022719.1 tyrosine-type recombinase/integrase [Cupriavidus taiwanensis]
MTTAPPALPMLPVDTPALPSNALASPVLPAGLSDAQLVHAWLEAKSAAGLGLRANTRSQYELEAHRLLWYAHAIDRRLATWQVAHASGYLAFLRDPPAHTVGDGRARRASPGWRPLRGPLSEASRRQSAVIVGILFDWLVRVGALRVNPFVMVPRARAVTGPGSQRRFLELEQVAAVFDAIENRPGPTLWAELHKARDRLLLALLVQTGLRASEVAALTWADFELQWGRTRTFWTVRIRQAKGGDDQLVPCDNAMDELARFRRLVGLPPEPRATDSIAVIPAMGGGRLRAAPIAEPVELLAKLGRPLRTRQGIYAVVRAAFAEAADRLELAHQGEQAARLRAASTHWLRHTHATHLLRAGVPVTDVQRALRHRDINTTRRYTHEALEDVARALAGKTPGTV